MKISMTTMASVLLMVLAISFPALAGTISLVPSAVNVAPGNTVDVSVVLSTNSPITMRAMSEIIFYDPLVFTFVDSSVVQGTALTPVWDFGAAAINPGELRVGSYTGGEAANGTLFTFTLLVNAGAPLGPSLLTWGNGSFLGDGFGYADADWNDALLPSTGTSINVATATVPEPSLMLLLGVGLAAVCLVGSRWKK